MNKEDIRATRQSLCRYFEQRAIAEKVDINPTVRDAATVELAGRLYEEEMGNRQFIVYPFGGDLQGIDAFSKQTGPDLEIALLGVFVGTDKKYFSAIWDLYRKWLHDRVETQILLKSATLADRRTRGSGPVRG